MKTNYHTHTSRCKHAVGTDEEYVLAAIEAKFDILGFSDHTPWEYDSNFKSRIRMLPNQIDEYINSIKLLREKYRGLIDLKIGLECEYFPDYLSWLKKLLNSKEIDYIILGNHYHRTDENGGYNGNKTNDIRKLRKYVDDCIKAIDTGLYSYIAHPDLIYFDSNSKYYKEEITRLCQYASKHQMILEYNLNGILTKRNYPSNVFWEIAAKEGCLVIIGYDAHFPDTLKESAVHKKAVEYLNSLGMEIVEVIPNRKRGF
jgi:histidinol phosphate phosphatase HisJ family